MAQQFMIRPLRRRWERRGRLGEMRSWPTSTSQSVAATSPSIAVLLLPVDPGLGPVGVCRGGSAHGGRMLGKRREVGCLTCAGAAAWFLAGVVAPVFGNEGVRGGPPHLMSSSIVSRDMENKSQGTTVVALCKMKKQSQRIVSRLFTC